MASPDKRNERANPGTPDPSDPPAAAKVAPLDSAAREVLKGTLVSLRSDGRRQSSDTSALVKYSAVRQMSVSAGDVEAVRSYLEQRPWSGKSELMAASAVSESTFDILQHVEAAPVPAMRPDLGVIASIPGAELAAFAEGLVDVRSARVALHAPAGDPGQQRAGAHAIALNAAVAAARGFAVNAAIQPVGLLSLERIEMVPTGIERGELVATIPLAPGEQTAVTHKEWSVTSKEFTSIVTDSLESTSETGVTDNTDLSQSTTSQTQHSTQFNITGTVQGGIPMINGSSTAGATVQAATSDSTTGSIKHATAMTQRASARSRQEHKTTVSTTTVTGSAEVSTRVLSNPSPTNPIRIDYFSLMRKWRVRLYRFGLRMTYDLVIPEPGASMRRDYAELESLRSRQGPFIFSTPFSAISNDQVDEYREPHARWCAQYSEVPVPG